MRRPSYSGQFKRDVKLARKRGKDMGKLAAVMQALMDGSPLDRNWLDHPLRGRWKGCRDLHVEPDWLLIYVLDGDELRFERTGTHSDLFDG